MNQRGGLTNLFGRRAAERAQRGDADGSALSCKVLSVSELPPGPPPRRMVRPTQPLASVDAFSQRTSEIVLAAADTLAASALYFTRDNLATLGAPPDPAPWLETLDPLLCAAIADCEKILGVGAPYLTLMDCQVELAAGVEAARLAAQIFGLLRDSKMPPSGMKPLRSVTDAAIRAIRAAGAAILSGEAKAGMTARSAMGEAERMGFALLGLMPGLAAYRSETLCRLIRAADLAALVAADRLTEVAVRLTIPVLAEPPDDPLSAGRPREDMDNWGTGW